MKYSNFLLLLFTVAIIKLSSAQGYCPRAPSQCKNIIRQLSQTEKDAIVAKHNQLRAYIYAGKETQGSRGPPPAAKNADKIPPLQWDDNLATLAQTFANECNPSTHKCFVGAQNNGYTSRHIQEGEDREDKDKETFLSLVQDWYDEVKDWDRADTYLPLKDKYDFEKRNDGKFVRHFTTVVGEKIRKIGCGGVVDEKGPNSNKYILICNYSPGYRGLVYTPIDFKGQTNEEEKPFRNPVADVINDGFEKIFHDRPIGNGDGVIDRRWINGGNRFINRPVVGEAGLYDGSVQNEDNRRPTGRDEDLKVRKGVPFGPSQKVVGYAYNPRTREIEIQYIENGAQKTKYEEIHAFEKFIEGSLVLATDGEGNAKVSYLVIKPVHYPN